MTKRDSDSFLLGIAWSTGIAVVLTLLALISGAGVVPRTAIMVLGCIGFIAFSVAVKKHGWLRAPYWFGTPIRAAIILGGIAVAMCSLCWRAWPPIRRHVLDDTERSLFEAPLNQQARDRYEIQLACPAADEATCVYAGQFVDLFKDAGWKVQDYQVKRVSLGLPYDGVRLFSYVKQYPAPDAHSNVGVWTEVSPSLITIYRSFHAIGIEAEQGIRIDEKQNEITIYFGSERADESKPTGLTRMYGNIPELKKQNPELKLN
jgi:hypothetical protein